MKKMLPCLILAGGLGTRLRSVLGDELPKALAPVNGRPFLWWLLLWLSQQGITDVILSVGYGQKPIKESISRERFGMSITFVEENEPLGTGGAIVNAVKIYGAPEMIVLNGDSLSDLHLRGLAEFFEATRCDIAIAATQVPQGSRYGMLGFNDQSRRLQAFDKIGQTHGFVNAGVYAVSTSQLLAFDVPKKFSFEQDFLRHQVDALDIRVFPEITEFIDIGVPSDYERSQTIVPRLLRKRTSEA
jgi:D-glycero-alpha-D-manno-heptose 1-phosphate guanylyltransferase